MSPTTPPGGTDRIVPVFTMVRHQFIVALKKNVTVQWCDRKGEVALKFVLCVVQSHQSDFWYHDSKMKMTDTKVIFDSREYLSSKNYTLHDRNS